MFCDYQSRYVCVILTYEKQKQEEIKELDLGQAKESWHIIFKYRYHIIE